METLMTDTIAPPITILAIDDDLGDAEILKRHLGGVPGLTFQFRHVSDPREAATALTSDDVDVTFLDYNLGTATGLELLRYIRSAGDTRPVIVLTGNGSAYAAADVTRAGADEYLAKTDLSPATLQRALQRATDRHERRRASEELVQRQAALAERLAENNVELSLSSRLDSLTRLLNRAAWAEAAMQEHERASRYGRMYSVLMIDVDHFKLLNDSLGHQAGDDCLRKLGKCFSDLCRSLEAVGRYGGEEFVVLAPETEVEGAMALAERLRKAVWDLAIPHAASPIAERVTISVGVATAPADSWEDVVKNADEALYVAKTLGRNMVWRQPAENTLEESESLETETTVVAIDDDAGDAELLRRSLEHVPELTFQFEHCSTSDAGRAALVRHPDGIVFLDYQLGEESGLEVLREIRAGGFIGSIVAVTGLADQYIVAELMRAGADDYIAKADVSPDQLNRAIRNAENQHLRRKAQMRNRQLLAELQTTKKSLEGKNHRLTELYKTAHQFVDNVSHEFRTPLTVIKEFTSIMRDGLAGEIKEEQREYLDIVLNRTDDLSTMVDDMLDISKLEAGVLGVSRRNCTMESIVKNVRTTLERKAIAAKVNLEIAVADGLPTVYCDPEKVGRVMINLTVNAIKFCDEGGSVFVSLRRTDDDAFVEVSVTDDGPGIAPENVQAIFERFKQVEGNVRSSTKGFGLGLSIAKELVHLNLGDMSVTSELGKGSTFAFTVPTAEPENVLSLYLRRLYSSAVSLLTARVPDDTGEELFDEIDDFLQHQLRRSDLLFRAAPRRWLIVAAAGQAELGHMVGRLERARVETNRNRPARALPNIQLDIKGVWQGLDQSMELLKRFNAELGVLEAAPSGPASKELLN